MLQDLSQARLKFVGLCYLCGEARLFSGVGIGLETVLVLATLLLSRGLWLRDDFMLSIDGELMSAKGVLL